LQPLEVLWGVLLIFFALIGIVRGFLKELGVTTVLVVLLFGLSRIEDLLPRLMTDAATGAGFAMPTTTDTTGRMIWASFYILVIVFVGFVSYHGETLAFEGKPPKGPKGVFFAMLAGLLNGYLIAGSLWYFLDKYGYPIKFLQFQRPLTDLAKNLIPFLPLTLLRPFLPFLAVFMVIVRVVR
jgi:hypothetical protein